MTDEQNRRQLERRAVGVKVDIEDRLTGSKLGGLVNIHQEGLMLASSVELGVDNVYQLLLTPVEGSDSITPFELGVGCLWVREMSHEEGWWVGCKIISATEDASEKIDQITGLFG